MNLAFRHAILREAIKFIRTNRALTPDRPFFIYFAPGGTHGPHHVHKKWADKYKGKFDMGFLEWICWSAVSLSRKQLTVCTWNYCFPFKGGHFFRGEALKLWGASFFLDVSYRDHGSNLFLLDAGFLFCQQKSWLRWHRGLKFDE